MKSAKKDGFDPDNVTLQQLFPPCYDDFGSDRSLMSGTEWEIMVTYAKTRKYLLEKYPQSQEEARLLGIVWAEELDVPYQIDVARARQDSKGKVFSKVINELK